MRRVVSRTDLWLLAILVVLILGIWLIRGNTQGRMLSVRVNGKEVARLDLAKDGEYAVENGYGRNLVRIEDGNAFVAEADCPNRDCMHGRISRAGETLACLPHHLTLTVEGDSGVDAVSGK